MLQKQTVSSTLLTLLKNIMLEDIFKDFILVGGTSLALRYGHRKSVDIDLFTPQMLPEDLHNYLQNIPNLFITRTGKYSMTLLWEGVKIDLAHWNMTFENVELIENIRFATPTDIFAMKFDTITTRQEKKDFVDIYELCKHFSFHEGFQAYNKTYPYSKNQAIIFAAFGDIDQADASPMPEMLIESDWDEVKTKLKYYAKRYFLNL